MIPTYYAKNFSITQIFWNIEGFPAPQTVSTLWDNKFSKKSWDPYYPKIFQCQNIYETQGSPLRIFSVLWYKINYPKIVIPPFFIHNFFPYQKFSETQKHEFFSALWGKKLPTEKGDTPSLIRNFSIIEIFWNLEGFPYELFRYCETKKNSLEIRAIPPPYYPELFSIPEIFWNTEGFPCEVFRSCETKNFRQNRYALQISYAPPPMHGNFPYQNFFETRKGFPTNFFGTVRQKIFNGK